MSPKPLRREKDVIKGPSPGYLVCQALLEGAEGTRGRGEGGGWAPGAAGPGPRAWGTAGEERGGPCHLSDALASCWVSLLIEGHLPPGPPL